MSDEETAGVTLAQTAEGVPESPSVAALLRAGYERALAERAPLDKVITGYGEPETELHVLFRALEDYDENRKNLRPVIKKARDASQQEQAIARRTLALAAAGSYALVNGERHEIGHNLGLGLYAYLFPQNGQAGPATDDQAIILLFHSKTQPIMDMYYEYEQWRRGEGQEAEEEELGN